MPARLLLLFAATFLCFAPRTLAEDKADRVFGLDKTWSMHLTIQADDWKKMQPTNRGGPFGGFGPAQKAKPAEKNTERKPRGLFGLDFEYVKATLQIGETTYKDVAVRFKGSGTYISAQGLKRPFKIDLDRYIEGQSFMGLKKLTLNNSAMDSTGIREVLAYPVFRALGVPASRTAFVALTITIPGKYDKEFVGVYVLAESIDKTFLKQYFGSAKGLLLKPERVGAIEYLGEEWSAYEQRYQPRNESSKRQQQRLIEFTRLVQKADDATFVKQIGDYLDVDSFLRFVAGHVALSSMDSFVGMGRNYYLYLHPKTNKFVFIPWDVDLAFGTFLVVGSPEALMDLSIRQPHPNQNRLIERLLADKAVYATYTKHLEFAVTKVLTNEGIKKDLKTVQAIVEPLQQKEKSAAKARRESTGPSFGGMFARAPSVETFVEKRLASIKSQLAGERKGTTVKFGFGPLGGGGFRPPPGGFGPGQFLTRPILTASDKDKDGKLSKDEATTAARALFKALDKDGKGELGEKAVAAGLDRILPGPRFPGGRPPAGFPTLGETLARPIIEKSGQNGKLTEASLIAAAPKLFAEADSNKDGTLVEVEITTWINRLMPPPRFGPPGAAPRGGPAKRPPAAKPADDLPAIKELPNPFLFSDGSAVRTKEDWDRRRIELKKLFQDYMYGHLPSKPRKMTIGRGDVFVDKDNNVALQDLTLKLEQDDRSITLSVRLAWPADARAPAPVIVQSGFGRRGGAAAPTAGSGKRFTTYTKRGYAVAECNFQEAAADSKEKARSTGVYQLFGDKIDCGGLMAWAWCVHRVIDAIETVDKLDAKKVIVTGHSRYGKAALIAGAFDERIALTVPSHSGCAGVAPYRFIYGKSEQLHNIVGFAHWFRPNFNQFVGKVERLPVDQHLLLALVAPRALMHTEGIKDAWTNPEGAQLTHLAARKVYGFLKAEDNISIRYRPVGHVPSNDDLMDFADRVFFKKPVSTEFGKLPYKVETKGFTWDVPK
jgi:hypothetical protein